MNEVKAHGYVMIDGIGFPYLGEVNTTSQQEWNHRAAAQAIKLYRAEVGRDPESAQQAFDYLRKEYPTEAPQQDDIPVIRAGKIEIVLAS